MLTAKSQLIPGASEPETVAAKPMPVPPAGDWPGRAAGTLCTELAWLRKPGKEPALM